MSFDAEALCHRVSRTIREYECHRVLWTKRHYECWRRWFVPAGVREPEGHYGAE